jgi:hypothetical protein
MKRVKHILALVLLVSMGVLLPNIFLYAQGNPKTISIATGPAVEFYDSSVPGPDGLILVDWEMKFFWSYEGNEIGYAWQYVSGIIKTNGMATLIGYGVFTSTVPELSGTISYTIGNNWDGVAEIWGFRMRIVGGTGDFEGIKGTVRPVYPVFFLMRLNFNPWD